jgi:opacity protein-like surface antigen
MRYFRNAAFLFAFSIGLVNIAAAQESYISVFGGLGYATTEVVFEPSEIPVASHRDGGFAYQTIGGMDFEPSEAFRLFGEYRYLGTRDVATELFLLPGELDIENRAHMINFGVRFHF